MQSTLKKIIIISGISLLLIVIIWMTISIINNSTFHITKAYDVRNDTPYLTVCFNKEIKKDNSFLESQNFTAKPRYTRDSKCTAFQLITDNKLNVGHYYTRISAESESGQKITNEDFLLKIVDSPGKNTLSDDDIGKLIDANNDVDMEEWMDYWRQKPIYKFVDSKSLMYKGAVWSIALRVDNNDSPIILVYINMPSSSQDRPHLAKEIEKYKKSALSQLKEWGVGPNDYKIDFRFND